MIHEGQVQPSFIVSYKLTLMKASGDYKHFDWLENEWTMGLFNLRCETGVISQDAEKVRQRRSRIAQRLNVPKRTPRLFARYGLAGRPF